MDCLNTAVYLKITFLINMFCVHILLFVPFIALVLFACGDLELNPGPSTPFFALSSLSKTSLHQSENLFLWPQYAQKEQSIC